VILGSKRRSAEQRKRVERLRLELEEKLRQAERLEALGRLAGGVAHDFNNHLSIIHGSAYLLLARLAGNDPLRADAERIMRTAEQGTQLVRQLLSVCRGQAAELRVLDLTRVVRDMVPTLRLLLGEHITLRVALAPTLWAVRADVVQVERVITNLVTNARDAILSDGTGSGLLTVETANVEAGANGRSGTTRPPGSEASVMLAVSDCGCGMTPEVQRRIFEPFFTTKKWGNGTGLGLSIAREIVTQHGGLIICESEPGRGTTLRIYLPRHCSRAGALTRDITATTVISGGSPQSRATTPMMEGRRRAPSDGKGARSACMGRSAR
jgi:two-component system cell cycle sensor histidine kinase/response regulator CckA